MAEAAPQSPLSLAEDRVARILNGPGAHQVAELGPLSELEKLIKLKMLRMEYPHQSTAVRELDSAIYREVGKIAKAAATVKQ